MESSTLIGAVLDGRYKVLDAIAEGAMGVVYRAERVKLGRIVAIKVLHDELPNELSSRKRFEIEAMAMAKLEHPHCAAVLDVGVHEEKPFVVMDFVSGPNLKELIANGPLPVPRAVEIVRQTLSGLAHAHEHGIIHRDIKPANIVLSQKSGLGDHVKILDFGLARLSADSNLTTGIVVGTPSYMAPEQIRGVEIDKRADLYACGILLFELLTGKKPFFSPKDDPIEVCSMHLKSPPPKLAATRPGTDFGELEGIITKAMAKSPGDRYESAEEMATALAATIGRHGAPITPAVGIPTQIAAEPTPAPAPSPASQTLLPQPAARPFPFTKQQLAIGGGVLVLLVIIIAVLANRGGDSKTTVVVTPGDPAVNTDDPNITMEKGDPVGEVLSRANEFVANGRREAAIDLLSGARKTFPDDARLAYLGGKLYFAKLWYTDGLKQFRDAVRLDPAYKSDAELIKTVLKAFNTTPRYDSALASFLRDQVGAAAKPLLEETAANHPNPSIRARAAAELRRY
ncbi:MAG: serine/threonine protein kinase [Myxococcota bacterium]|nr:serine/threonine protein kinase [Myxococcota bacterium]